MLFVGLISLLLFICLSMLQVPISNEEHLKIIDSILSSISISLGFFGALFTFVFGLKDNKLLNKIMLQSGAKSQFKWLNILIISTGFIIIFLSLWDLVIIFFNILCMKVMQYYLACFIFSLSSAFYGFLIIFMFVITFIIFKEDKSKQMETRKNPPLKKQY